MEKMSFEYAKGRFVNPARIVSANVYKKKPMSADNNGNYTEIIRVALDLDVKDIARGTVYSDTFDTIEQATEWIKNIPTS